MSLFYFHSSYTNEAFQHQRICRLDGDERVNKAMRELARQITKFMGPRWDPPVSPRWASSWPQEPFYRDTIQQPRFDDLFSPSAQTAISAAHTCGRFQSLGGLGLQERWWTISRSGRNVRPQFSHAAKLSWAAFHAASFMAAVMS